MKIKINGTTKELEKTKSLYDLIKELSSHPQHVIAQLNERIIKQNDLEKTILQDGDHIELITFVGGG